MDLKNNKRSLIGILIITVIFGLLAFLSTVKLFDENDTEALPIIDNEEKLLGVVEKATIDHYLRGKVLELHKQIASLG